MRTICFLVVCLQARSSAVGGLRAATSAATRCRSASAPVSSNAGIRASGMVAALAVGGGGGGGARRGGWGVVRAAAAVAAAWRLASCFCWLAVCRAEWRRRSVMGMVVGVRVMVFDRSCVVCVGCVRSDWSIDMD